ncbi:MAG: long-chain fatty acid--CoA ligase, partial [Desulfobacterales bacterium]|nr:long-chain fatty acid--CoA ligase [Desulfobacterales bacterium]
YISGGENIYPAEVEAVFRTHPEVREAAVMGVPDDVWGEVGHAFVTCEDASELRPEDLIAFCKGRLAKYKWPKKITFCEDFPRTALGKVRKPLLTDPKQEVQWNF